ncbi:MAG: M56 family metallopeptidase [Acidobacteriota bacterium]|nr:M56 family metallopeptidase [Acidobacteriota bacterium]
MSETLADFVVRAAVQSGVIALTAIIFLPLLRRVRANVRYALLVAVIAVAALVPFVPAMTMQNALPGRTAEPVARQSAVARTSAASIAMPRVHAPATLARIIAASYVLFLIYPCASLVLALRHARRLRANAVPSDACGVPVLLSREVRAPVTVGFLRPAILLPHDLPPGALEAVIGHELAHVRRRDALVQLALEIATLPIAFHPLVWWLKRETALARELACDAAVTPAVVEPRQYARILVAIAQQATSPRGAIAFGAAATLERRLLSLRERPRRGALAAMLVAVTVAISAYAAWRTPLHLFGLRRDDIAGQWVLDARHEFRHAAPLRHVLAIPRLRRHAPLLRADARARRQSSTC